MNWNGEGLPPVGTTCIYNFETRPYEIIAHRDGFAIGWRNDAVTIASKIPQSFRPIKSDREKAIEEMLKLNSYDGDRVFMGALYDAGYRKVTKDQ
jgi:hypothetical protein